MDREDAISRGVPPGYIDLRPLMTDPDAATVLMLARGQLNQAFRAHGLVLPDPMPADCLSDANPTELADPAAAGIEHALARFQDAFLIWSGRMPFVLAQPVLAILRQTQQALENPDAAGAGTDAVATAYNFLLGRRENEEGRTESA